MALSRSIRGTKLDLTQREQIVSIPDGPILDVIPHGSAHDTAFLLVHAVVDSTITTKVKVTILEMYDPNKTDAGQYIGYVSSGNFLDSPRFIFARVA